MTASWRRALQHELPTCPPGGIGVIHGLLVIAVVLFVLWLLFNSAGGLINLIWLAIIVLVILWLVGFVRGRSAQ